MEITQRKKKNHGIRQVRNNSAAVSLSFNIEDKKTEYI